MLSLRKFIYPLFKNFLYGCLLLIAPAACTDNGEQDTPAGTLPMPKMAAITADIHLAEAAVAMQGLTFQEALSRYDRYEREIMRRHQTDTVTYRKSYEFYASESTRLADLMKLVADTLSARQNALRGDSTATAATPNTIPQPQ